MAIAQTPAEDLARARRMVDVELRYKAAIRIIDRVLRDPGLQKKQRVEAYRLLGIAYSAKGAPESAEAAFGELLALEPAYVLDPLLSPKIRSAFERAKERVQQPIRLLEVTAAPEGRRVAFSARLDDGGARVATVMLFSRFGDKGYDAMEMNRDGDGLAALLILPALDRLRVDYYLEARDDDGRTIARAGSPEAPSSVVMERQTEIAPPPPAVTPPPPSDAWYEQWWVWAIVVGVVGVGVTATVVAVEMNGSTPPDGTLDPIQLE